MANVIPKTVVTQKMSATSTSHSRTDVAVRDLNVVIDEPEARGGTNQGASPTETLGVALAGCINVISHKVAESLDVDLGEMTIDVATQFDRRGVMLEDEIDIEKTRSEHLEKIAGDGKEIVEVVPRMSATTRPLSGRWVDSEATTARRSRGGRHEGSSRFSQATRTTIPAPPLSPTTRRC